MDGQDPGGGEYEEGQPKRPSEKSHKTNDFGARPSGRSGVVRWKKKRRFLINPEESRNLRRWDLSTSICLIFVCFVTPAEVAFGKTDPEVDALFVINRLIDLVFLADLVLQFFIMYPVQHRYGTVYVTDNAAIIKRYLKTWFLLDLLSIVPFDMAPFIIDSREVSGLGLFRVVRLVRLSKLIRLVKGLRLFHRWELEFGFSYKKLTLWQLFVVVLIATHWVSCVLGIVNNIQGEVCLSPGEPDGCVTTWLEGQAMELTSQGTTLTGLRAYFIALHVSATIIVHPHSSPPTSDGERILFTLLLFVGGFVWTRVISKTTAVTTSMNFHEMFYHKTMDDLNFNANTLQLPMELKRKLRAFFQHTRDASQRATWIELLKRMSPSLQNDVQFQTHKVWLHRVPYLRGTPRGFLASVAAVLRSAQYAQGEIFGTNFVLYIMNRGMAIKLNISGGQPMMAGTVWGEEHMLLNVDHLLSINTSRALAFVEVLHLERDAFDHVRSAFPHLDKRLRKHYVNYVVYYGMKYEARKRKQKEQHFESEEHHELHNEVSAFKRSHSRLPAGREQSPKRIPSGTTLDEAEPGQGDGISGIEQRLEKFMSRIEARLDRFEERFEHLEQSLHPVAHEALIENSQARNRSRGMFGRIVGQEGSVQALPARVRPRSTRPTLSHVICCQDDTFSDLNSEDRLRGLPPREAI